MHDLLVYKIYHTFSCKIVQGVARGGGGLMEKIWQGVTGYEGGGGV